MAEGMKGKVNSPFGKYLVYAIGETVLVVVGILIALQINNWNLNRLAQVEEYKILNALHDEFSSNEILFKECLTDMDTMSFYIDSIRKHLIPAATTLEDSTLYKWLGQIGATQTCIPNSEVLKDATNSGKLSLIKNDSIRLALAEWSAMVEELHAESENWEDDFSNNFYPYTYKWISWDDVDYYSDPDNPRNFKSQFDIDPKLMLRELEFQNVLSIHYWRINLIHYLEESLLMKTQEINELIVKYLAG